MRSRWLLAICFLATGSSWASSSSAAPRRKDWPCASCLVDVPDAKDGGANRPLLVLLHGDGQTAANAASPWEKTAAARGWVLFAPQCPKADGCKETSWWKWDHDPSWLDQQVKTIEGTVAIDPDRIHLAGWSGGSSWMGYYAPKLVGRYASLSINGGGMAPSDRTTCVQSCPLPVRFLVGDHNPLHGLAKGLRAYFETCKHEVTWDLIPKADHGGELVALSKPAKIATIFDWFDAHPRTCPVLANTVASSSAAASASTSPPPLEEKRDSGPDSDSGSRVTSVPSVAPASGRCSCRVVHDAATEGWKLSTLLLLLVLNVARRAGASRDVRRPKMARVR